MEIETKTYADGTTATGPGPLPEQSPAEQDAAANQCCGKCDKPTDDAGLTSDDYRGAIRDLAHRLQTADIVIQTLVAKAGGSVTITEADGERAIGQTVVTDSDAESKAITFRLVKAEPAPVQ